ncbi:MAG: hypothetical protein EXS37_13565 [Opitutus sp.]|nr:hypothetical protein [Opitutus sp.]
MTNALGSVTSTVAVLVVTPPSSRLINLATRGSVGTGDRMLIAGFFIQGTVPKTVLIRAVGPALGGFGVTGTLADPILDENDNWGSGGDSAQIAAAGAAVGAFGLSAGSKDAVLLVTLSPGNYTAQVSGVGTFAGIALVEVYEVP